jgi:hypothetical protein
MFPTALNLSPSSLLVSVIYGGSGGGDRKQRRQGGTFNHWLELGIGFGLTACGMDGKPTTEIAITKKFGKRRADRLSFWFVGCGFKNLNALSSVACG